jgi:hypothetical protein
MLLRRAVLSLSDESIAFMNAAEVSSRWNQRLFGLLKERGRLLLLLNRFHGVPSHLGELLQSAPQQRPLVDEYFGDDESRAPLLVSVDMTQLPLLEETVDSAVELSLSLDLPMPTVCGWLTCGKEIEIDRVAKHLRRQMELRFSGRLRSAFFIYFDPRVCPHLPNILLPQQWRDLTGPLDQWLLPGRAGQLVELAGAGQSTGMHRGLIIAPDQEDALMRIEVVNNALRLLHRRGCQVPSGKERDLDRLVTRAIDLGLSRPDDQAAYVALVFDWPADREPVDSDEWVCRGLQLAQTGLPLSTYIEKGPGRAANYS